MPLPQGKQITQAQLQILRQQQQLQQQQPPQQQTGSPQIKAVNKPQQVTTLMHTHTHTCLLAAFELFADMALFAGKSFFLSMQEV